MCHPCILVGARLVGAEEVELPPLTAVVTDFIQAGSVGGVEASS